MALTLADVTKALAVLKAAGLHYANWPKTDHELAVKAQVYGDALRARGCDQRDLTEAVMSFTRQAGGEFPDSGTLAGRAAQFRARRFVTVGVEVDPGVLAIREVPREDALPQPEAPRELPSPESRREAMERLGAALDRGSPLPAARQSRRPSIAAVAQPVDDGGARDRLDAQLRQMKAEAVARPGPKKRARAPRPTGPGAESR